MIIGVPKEIKNHEYRVGLTPASVAALVRDGHRVLVQLHAGHGIGATTHDYVQVGAEVVATAAEVFASSDMIVKVKEPQPQECAMIRGDQIIFTYLHLAADPVLTQSLINTGATCIAYETVTDDFGRLPLLAPMSEVAGRMAPQVGAAALQKANGGSGVLLGGVPGVAPGIVTILGGGSVGMNAAKIALGMGADVTIFDSSLPRLRELDNIFQGRVKTLYSMEYSIDRAIINSDLVVGAVLITGESAPKLIGIEHLQKMREGSVIVDVAIDQGGCTEFSRATTHADPTFTVNGIVHYCVANMPGAVPKTSTYALNNATLPFARKIANMGWVEACRADRHLRNGLNIVTHLVTHEGVAKSLGLNYCEWQ